MDSPLFDFAQVHCPLQGYQDVIIKLEQPEVLGLASLQECEG